jgi:hypothetical protein
MKTFYIVSHGTYDYYRVDAILESEQDAKDFMAYYPVMEWNAIEPMLDGTILLDLYRKGFWRYQITIKLEDGEIIHNYKDTEPELDPITKCTTNTWESRVVAGRSVMVPPYDVLCCDIWAQDHIAAIRIAQAMRQERLSSRANPEVKP